MTAGSGSSAGRRRSGRIRFVLFSIVVLFGGGFYTGVYATKRVITSNSGILQRVFGVQPPPAPSPAVAPTQPAAVSPPSSVAVAATPAPPPTTPPAPVAKPAPAEPPVEKPADANAATQSNGATAQPSNSAETDQSAPPVAHRQDAGGTGAEQSQLAKQVEDYNDMLHRIQDALRHESIVHQKLLDPKLKTQDLKLLTDQENNLFAEISRAAKHAENLQDAIRADANYAALYMEGSNCAARKDVPTKLLDLDLDKLKFIDKAP